MRLPNEIVVQVLLGTLVNARSVHSYISSRTHSKEPSTYQLYSAAPRARKRLSSFCSRLRHACVMRALSRPRKLSLVSSRPLLRTPQSIAHAQRHGAHFLLRSFSALLPFRAAAVIFLRAAGHRGGRSANFLSGGPALTCPRFPALSCCFVSIAAVLFLYYYHYLLSFSFCVLCFRSSPRCSEPAWRSPPAKRTATAASPLPPSMCACVYVEWDQTSFGTAGRALGGACPA